MTVPGLKAGVASSSSDEDSASSPAATNDAASRSDIVRRSGQACVWVCEGVQERERKEGGEEAEFEGETWWCEAD